MVELRITGIRGDCCKTVAVIFSNRKEVMMPRHIVVDLLGKTRFQAMARKSRLRLASRRRRDIL